MSKYYLESHHDAIISREDFEAVASLIEQRAKEKGILKGTGKYSSRYAYSGIIECGECGSTFKRRIHMPGKPSEYVAWCCKKHIDTRSKDCTMVFIRDECIKVAFVTMMNRLYSGRNTILKPLVNALKMTDGGHSYEELIQIEKSIRENSEQVQVLTGLMSKGYLEPALFNERNNVLQAEAVRLKEKRVILQSGIDGGKTTASEVDELLKYVTRHGIIEEYNDEIFKRFVVGITVYSPTEIGFRLKCGLCLKERMAR